jgi:hypothetical protein
MDAVPPPIEEEEAGPAAAIVAAEPDANPAAGAVEQNPAQPEPAAGQPIAGNPVPGAQPGRAPPNRRRRHVAAIVGNHPDADDDATVIFSPITNTNVPLVRHHFILPYFARPQHFDRLRSYFPRLELLNGLSMDDATGEFIDYLCCFEVYAIILAFDAHRTVHATGLHPYVLNEYARPLQLLSKLTNAECVVVGAFQTTPFYSDKPTVIVAPYLTSVQSYALDEKVSYNLSFVSKTLYSTVNFGGFTSLKYSVQADLDRGYVIVNDIPRIIRRLHSVKSNHYHVFYFTTNPCPTDCITPKFDDVLSNDRIYSDVTDEFTKFFHPGHTMYKLFSNVSVYSFGRWLLFGTSMHTTTIVCKRVVQLASSRYAGSERNSSTFRAIINDIPSYHKMSSSPSPSVEAIYLEAVLVWSSPFGDILDHMVNTMADFSSRAGKFNSLLVNPTPVPDVFAFTRKMAANLTKPSDVSTSSSSSSVTVDDGFEPIRVALEDGRPLVHNVGASAYNKLVTYIAGRIADTSNGIRDGHVSHRDYIVLSDIGLATRIRKSMAAHRMYILKERFDSPVDFTLTNREVCALPAAVRPPPIHPRHVVLFFDVHSAWYYTGNDTRTHFALCNPAIEADSPRARFNWNREVAYHATFGLLGACENCSNMDPSVVPPRSLTIPYVNDKLNFRATKRSACCVDHRQFPMARVKKPMNHRFKKRVCVPDQSTITNLFGEWMYRFYTPYLPCRCNPCVLSAIHKRIDIPVLAAIEATGNTERYQLLYINLFHDIRARSAFGPFSYDEFLKRYHYMLNKMTKNRAEQAKRDNRLMKLHTPLAIYITPILDDPLVGHSKIETLIAMTVRNEVLIQEVKLPRVYSSMNKSYSKLMPFFYYLDEIQFNYFCNENPYQIYSLKGMNGLAKGDRFASMVHRYDSYLTIDGSSFDARTAFFIPLILRFYELFEPHPSIIQTISSCNSASLQFDDFVYKAQGPFNHSGMPNTSSFNFLVNFAVVQCIREELECSAFVEGDDVTIFYNRQDVNLDDVLQILTRISAEVGMVYTIDGHGDIRDATFCSGIFYPINIGQWVWSIELVPHLLSFHSVPSSKINMPIQAYRAALLVSLKALFWFIPGLGHHIDMIVDSDMPPVTGDWWLDQQVGMMENLDGTYVNHELINRFLQHRYGLQYDEVIQFIEGMVCQNWDLCQYYMDRWLRHFHQVHSYKPIVHHGEHCLDHELKYRRNSHFNELPPFGGTLAYPLGGTAVRAVCSCVAPIEITQNV